MKVRPITILAAIAVPASLIMLTRRRDEPGKNDIDPSDTDVMIEDPCNFTSRFTAEQWAIRQGAMALMSPFRINFGGGGRYYDPCGEPCNPGMPDGIPGSRTRSAIESLNKYFSKIARDSDDRYWGPIIERWPHCYTVATERYLHMSLYFLPNVTASQLAPGFRNQIDMYPMHPALGDIFTPGASRKGIHWPPVGWW